MEQTHTIQVTEEYSIQADIIYMSERTPNTIAIVANGFLCEKDTPLYLNTGLFFPASDIAIMRFNFFETGDKARKFGSTTVQEQIADLEKVIRYTKDLGYDSVFLITHSYSSHLALYTDSSALDGVIMWDPSLRVPRNIPRTAPYSEEHSCHILDRGHQVFVKKEVFESIKNLPEDPRAIGHITCPIQIVCGGESPLAEPAKEMLAHNMHPMNEMHIVPGAGHFFAEPGREKELYTHTLSFIQKILDDKPELESIICH